MQGISANLDTALKNNAHSVYPYVEVDWVNGKSLRNAKGYSSSDDYIDAVKSLSPSAHYRLNESFDFMTNAYTGPKPTTHWRFNTAASVGGNVVADECGYRNIIMNGTNGAQYTFGQTGVVQNNVGQLSSGVLLASSGGTFGYGLSGNTSKLLGDTENRWSIADNPSFSVEMWFKPASTLVDPQFQSREVILLYKSSKKYLLNQPGAVDTPEWILSVQFGIPTFTIFNSRNNLYGRAYEKTNVFLEAQSYTAIAQDVWHHIVATYDGGSVSLYVDNELVGSSNTTNGMLSDLCSSYMCIGARYFTYTAVPGPETSPTTNFLGTIDEVLIYNDTLSMSDVSQRWKSGSLNVSNRVNTVRKYFNISDISGNDFNGYLINPSGIEFRQASISSSYSPLSGRIDGGSFYFKNGTSIIDGGYLTSNKTSTGTSVFNGTNNLTVSAWVYVTAANATGSETIEMIAAVGQDSDNNGFADNGTAASNAWYLTLRKQPSNGAVLVSASINNNGTNPIATTAAGISLNQWHHIVMTVDSSNRVVIMVDGNYTSPTVSAASTTTMNTNPAWKLFIGGRQSTTATDPTFGERCRNTYISELAIFNAKTDIRGWATLYRSATLSNNIKNSSKFYNADQVINGQNEHTVTWAVLDALDENGNVITANGDYYVSERQETLRVTDYEYGWWSKNKSDGSGNFAANSKPMLYITFDPIFASHIDVYSSTKYGRIKSGNVYYQAEDGTWSAAQAFTLTSSSTSIVLSGGGATKIKAILLIVDSTQYANDVARIQEFSPRWTEIIANDPIAEVDQLNHFDVVSMDISKVRENTDSSVPLGATASNTCNLVLDNTDLQFNPENTGSDYYGLMTPGVKFTVGYKYLVAANTYQLIKQGTFYSDTWAIDSDNMTVSVSCRDYSGKMQDSNIVDGYLASDVTASEAIAELAARAGVPISKINVDYNYLKTVLRDRPDAFWRFNETTLQPFSLYFNGFTYLYSHPFADMLASSAGTDTPVVGTKKNTTTASRRVLPKTFYDFPFSESTIEFWIKTSSTSHGKTILNYATKRYANELRVNLSATGQITTKIQTYAPGTSDTALGVSSTATVSDGLWHHVAIVIDPAASAINGNANIRYIIDGVLDASGDVAFVPFKPSGQFLLGAGFITSTISGSIATSPHTLNTSSLFTGHLREVKIWATARSLNQITSSYSAPYQNQKSGTYSSNIYKNMISASNPVGYWPLDTRLNTATTGAFIRDISGYERNGTTNVAGLSSVDGPILTEDSSRALSFGASASYISVTNNLDATNTVVQTVPFEGTVGGNAAATAYNFSIFSSYLVAKPNTLDASFSMEFWIKPTSLPASTQTILSKYSNSLANQKEWVVSLTSAGLIELMLFNSTGATSFIFSSSAAYNNPVVANKWSHVVITLSGQKIQFYINGREASAGSTIAANQTYMEQSLTYAPTSPLRIGAADTLGNPLTNTAIAHVALYRRPLPAEEIYSHYSKAGYSGNNTPVSSNGNLAFYWPMNQGRFFSFEDLKNFGYAYTAAGKIKQNIVPNVTKFTNHLYAYTSSSTNNTIGPSLWKNSGLMAVTDHAGRSNYLTYRVGASGDTPVPYNEMDSTKWPTFNAASPITSEVETSTKFNSASLHAAYMNASPSLPLYPTATQSFSAEMWFKPTSVSTQQYLLVHENIGVAAATGTWRIYLDADGRIKFNATGLTFTPSVTQSVISNNVWHHVVAIFTFSGATTSVTIYLNGSPYVVYTATGTLTTASVKTIIGAQGSSTLNSFNGFISNVAIYNRILTTVQIGLHYERGRSLYQYVFPNLAVSSDSFWAEMLKIATADIGMFFFDENNNFTYEHGRSYDDSIDSQHAVVQYEINDGDFASASSNKSIVSGSQNIDLQVNKIIVKVYSALSVSARTTGIWAAESGTSLAVCKLNSSLSSNATDVISLSLTLNPAGIYEPLWPDSGIVKIDNEFIKYSKTAGSSLLSLERGYWGSTPQPHAAGAVVKEAREFNLEWSSQPVFFVSYPFITGVIYDKTLVASNWRFNGVNGYIRLYPSDNVVPSNKYVVVEGNNPVTKLDNYFHVAGYVIENKEKNKQNIIEVSEDYKDNIRRYGEKVLEIDNPLIQDAAYAKDLAQFLLKKYSNPVPVIDIKTLGLPHLQLGDRIKINLLQRLSIDNGEYWVMSISQSYNGGIEQSMTLRKVS